jgi:glycerol-3-phosphate acyltransferase PlsY
MFGSIPVALIVGRVSRGLDIREHGSGNTGTTNAFRVLGWRPGLIVLVCDVLKGSLAVLCMIVSLKLAQGLILQQAQASAGADLESAYNWMIALGQGLATGVLHDIPLALAMFAAICGHMFSPFMGFKGGKGIATAFGALLMIMPIVALIVLVVFAALVAATRIVSVGSLAAALALPIATAALHHQSITYMVLTVLVAVIIYIAHRKNIVRIVHGEESHFSIRKKGQ